MAKHKKNKTAFDLLKLKTRVEGYADAQHNALESELSVQLRKLQEYLFAAQSHSVLIVLQGMDASGKDGIIKYLYDHLNPVGVGLKAFKKPSEHELAHDFLWRIHPHVPARGEFMVFNRSHYEDVVTTKVLNIIDEPILKHRIESIHDFEKHLERNGVIIIKLFLHISKAVQRERLLEREQDVLKYWKLDAEDWKNRKLWDDYLSVYSNTLNETNYNFAPWSVIPADDKPTRNIFALKAVVDRLREYQKNWKKKSTRLASERVKAIRKERS